MASPDLVFNPFDREHYRDPYPTYKRMREEAPVYRNDALGLAALFRFDDVVAAHIDVDRFSSEMNLSESEAADTGRYRPIVFTDPPYHTSLRGLVNQPFRPRQIERMGDVIREVTVRRLDEFAGRGEVDIAQELAIPVPMEVICRILGVPDADIEEVQYWADTSIEREPGTNQPTPAGVGAREALDDYLKAARKDRLARPTQDLLSVLAHSEMKDEEGVRPLNEAEFVANGGFFLVAGNETTAKAITHSILLLERHPDQRAVLARDASAIPNAVEETLRMRPPAHWQHRVAKVPIELHGVKIEPGTFVALVTASACHDERVFPDPERFDIARRIDHHVAFGWGRHICMGAWLARLEMRITIEELLARYPEYEIVEDGLEQNYAINVSGYSKMPIRI
jgi:cytochrome P450